MQIEGSEVQGIFTRLPPVRGLWGLPETLRVAQVMSPSRVALMAQFRSKRGSKKATSYCGDGP